MTPSPAGPGPNQANISVPTRPATMALPGEGQIASLDRQDFNILIEGSGGSRDASIRDVSIGICSTALTAAVCFFFTTSFSTVTHEGGPAIAWGCVITFGSLAVLTIASGATAAAIVIRNRGEKHRPSYRDLVARLRSELGIPS